MSKPDSMRPAIYTPEGQRAETLQVESPVEISFPVRSVGLITLKISAENATVSAEDLDALAQIAERMSRKY
ncbi:hypothetical protein [uncultured Maritimibacter sp.]|uniref:hypothetical protein n=1 Tax=uncultured Maritimibacter sp. TaxID=991866 RepID=UPI002594F780|nr:hypothetical protein [uncultured Maritimibacter sp.]